MDIINNMINDQFFKNPILVEERFFGFRDFMLLVSIIYPVVYISYFAFY